MSPKIHVIYCIKNACTLAQNRTRRSFVPRHKFQVGVQLFKYISLPTNEHPIIFLRLLPLLVFFCAFPLFAHALQSQSSAVSCESCKVPCSAPPGRGNRGTSPSTTRLCRLPQQHDKINLDTWLRIWQSPNAPVSLPSGSVLAFSLMHEVIDDGRTCLPFCKSQPRLILRTEIVAVMQQVFCRRWSYHEARYEVPGLHVHQVLKVKHTILSSWHHSLKNWLAPILRFPHLYDISIYRAGESTKRAKRVGLGEIISQDFLCSISRVCSKKDKEDTISGERLGTRIGRVVRANHCHVLLSRDAALGRSRTSSEKKGKRECLKREEKEKETKGNRDILDQKIHYSQVYA